MIRKRLYELLLYTLTGYTIAHGLLFFLIFKDRELYNSITFHYSDGLLWYVLFFGMPLLAGVAFYFGFRNKIVARWMKTLLTVFCVLQLTFNLVATTLNYNYWGYAFKRPPVFQEILDANNVSTCSRVSNIDSNRFVALHVILDSSRSMDNLYGRRDYYSGCSDRIFMVFQDRSNITGYLSEVPKIYKNQNMKASDTLLHIIEKQVLESEIFENVDNKRKVSHYLDGIITEFRTTDLTQYVFASFNRGEISNDHYPFYEFLFLKKNHRYEMVKKQMFYTDVAGIEGFEYAKTAPFFSLLLTIIGGVIVVVIGLIKSIRHRIR